jgi:hypothetical protein
VSLILHAILSKVKIEHDSQRLGNSRRAGKGGVKIMPIAFMDNATILLSIEEEACWFLKRVQMLGVMVVGVIIGKDKTKIITNITGVSLLPFLPPA